MSEESARDIAPEAVPPAEAPPGVETTPVAADAPPPSTEAAKPKPYPFSVMSVLGTAWRVMQRNLVPFVVLAAILEVPTYLLQQAFKGGSDGDLLLGILLQSLAGSFATALVTYGAIMELNGSRPPLRTCIARGVAALPRVIGVSLISALAIGAATVLLVVPGIIVGLMFFVVVPVTVVERTTIDGAMKRSRELTSGRKGDLFLIAILAGAVNVSIVVIAPQFEPWAASLWSATASALSLLFFAVTTSVAYVVLRRIREGTQVPEIATAIARIRS